MTRATPLLLLLASCATLAGVGQGDVDLPTTGAGPFRKLQGEEVPGLPPYVLDTRVARYREPDALAREGGGVQLFAVATRADGHDAIVRTVAEDGRAFFGAADDSGHQPEVVLQASLPWEGTDLSGPSGFVANGITYLYYATDGGIGRAHSNDGRTFEKDPNPVLVGTFAAPLRAPSVFRRADGALGMLISAGCFIYEAMSPDGALFQFVDADPSTPKLDAALAPAGSAVALLPNELPPFDEECVADPYAFPRVTVAGRTQLRVLYTGKRPGSSAIGFAGRYGDSGRLTRNTTPVLRSTLNERAPTAWETDGETYLYVEMDKIIDKSAAFPTIGAAIAPATTPPLPRSFQYPPSL